jgi:plastocyanin
MRGKKVHKTRVCKNLPAALIFALTAVSLLATLPRVSAAPLSVSVSPSTLYRGIGVSGTFTATASGGTPPYHWYEWYEYGYEYSYLIGAGASLTTLTVQKDTAGNYSFFCIVYDSGIDGFQATSNTVTLVVSLPPSVSVSPSTLSRIIGQSATFTATASGGTPSYTYRWYEGTTIVGTSYQLTISKSTAGTYSFYCRVWDLAYSTATSTTVTLVVSFPLSVSVSPSTLYRGIGVSGTFTATASGGTPPYIGYYWYENSSLIATYTNSTPLTVIKSTAGTYSFYCRVLDSYGATATSNTVTLVVSPLSVSVSPSTLSRTIGQSGTFTATASGGTPPYTYQWIEGSTTVGTTATLAISKSTAGTYSFYCRVWDYYGASAASNTVTLVVNPLSVSVSPSTLSRTIGQSGTFTATASGGTPPYTYQWIEGSTTVGTTATLTISKSTAGTYSFYCRVSDSAAATLNSDTVTLTATKEDVTPPQTEILLSGTSGKNNWYTSDVLVTLSASDDAGILNIGYSFDNVAWRTYTTPFTITSEGKMTVYYNSTDTSLNVESTRTREVKIDKTPPSGTLLINNGAESTNTTEVVLALSASDITSGISQMRFSNDGAEYSPWQAYGASLSWTLQNEAGQRTVYVQFGDNAGLTLTFSDSIVLSTRKGGEIPSEYIVAAVAAATIVSVVAYAWVRSTLRSKSPGEEKVKAPPPFFSKLRWLQAQVFELPPGGRQKIRRTNALRANALHSLDVRVGPADQEWLTPPEESAFPEDKLTWKNGVSHLQVVFSEPNHSPEPQTREIVLPREGSSTTCQFNFAPRDDVPRFRGRVIVLHGNRVLQTALLEGNVVSNPDQFPYLKLNFGIESIIQPNLSNLSSRKAFDLAFVANRTVDDSPGLTTIAGELAVFSSLAKIEIPIKKITSLLESVVKYPENYPKSIEDEKNVAWLRALALGGKGLYDWIVIDQIGEKKLPNISRIQLVSRVDEYLPLEFIYDMPAPKPDAPLCPKWHEALGEGQCEECKIRGTLAPADFVCPIGFWGLRLIIERHSIDPYNKEDLKGYDFLLKGEPIDGRQDLRVLKSAVFAASDKVDEEVPQSQEVFRVLQEVTHHKVEQVTTLEQWTQAIVTLQPSLIVLLTHISQSTADPEQTQLEIGKGVGLPQVYIDRQYILPSEDAPRPVVLLLGCTTMSTAMSFRSFAASFRRKGAAIVLSTITEVLGRHVAPISAQLVNNLEQAAEKGLSLGDALVLVRRKALVDGIPMVLSLVAIGDADWRFKTAEAS